MFVNSQAVTMPLDPVRWPAALNVCSTLCCMASCGANIRQSMNSEDDVRKMADQKFLSLLPNNE